MMAREADWDFAKTVLMFFIVLGHLCPSNPETWTPMTRVIGLFAIPLFFFISGYFQTTIYDYLSLANKYKKIFYRIIIPLFSWGFIYVILSALHLFTGDEEYNVANSWQFYKYSPFYILGFYWFLTALFFCQIIGSVFSLLLNKIKVYAFFPLAVSFPLFCLLPSTFFEHYHFSFIWLFYGLGMLYKKLDVKVLNHSYNIYIQILMATISFYFLYLGTQFMPQETFYFKSNLVIDTSVIFIMKRYALYTSVSIVMLYWIMQFYRKYMDSVIVKTFVSCGVDTLFIYCSHMLFLDFIYKRHILPCLLHQNGSVWNSFEEHVIGILLSIMLYFILQILCCYCKRFRWIRMLLMGVK